MNERSPRYWVIVVSKDHVLRGVSAGFIQANHGKKGPLERMQPGDWVVFYSPRVTMEGDEPCRAFTALARIKDAPVYQADAGMGFAPYRREAEFSHCKEIPIQPLIPELDFILDKQHWGALFRFGFFEIPKEDFERISQLMLAGCEQAV